MRADTFAAIAEEWLQTKRPTLSEGTWQRDRDQLTKLVGPYLGNRPIASIEAPDLLSVLRRLEERGIRDTAHRVRAVVGRVFRYAIATGRAKHTSAWTSRVRWPPRRHVIIPLSRTPPRWGSYYVRLMDMTDNPRHMQR